jgi:hypothetical protein
MLAQKRNNALPTARPTSNGVNLIVRLNCKSRFV